MPFPSNARFGAILVVIGLVACVPDSRFRRSALTPAVTRPVHTAPIDGAVEVAVSGTAGHVVTRFGAKLGDPALYIPRFELEGSLRLRAGPAALGLSGHVSWLGVARRSVPSVPPLNRTVVWGLGPDITLGHRFERTRVGIAANLSVHFNSVPWSSWERRPNSTRYVLDDEGTDVITLYRLAVAVQFFVNDRILLEAGPAVGNHVRNVGFSENRLEGSTLTSKPHGFVPFISARYRDPTGFFAQLQFIFPVGFGHVDIVPMTSSFSLGASFGD